MKSFHNGYLNITVKKDQDQITMGWYGLSDEKNVTDKLAEYLDSIIPELKGAPLVIQFNELEYMNSGTIPPFIKFLKSLNTEGIDTVVTYAKNSEWQVLSFKALEKFATLLPHICVKGL